MELVATVTDCADDFLAIDRMLRFLSDYELGITPQ